MILSQIYETILYFLKLTITTEALWLVIPLFISTVLIIIYFGLYREERPDWNTHFSNSFVLIFISIALLRFVYGINNWGAFNFVNYWGKTLSSIVPLAIGLILMKFNFEHLLPMKWATYINSPITVNLFAYAIILLVYSPEKITWVSIVSLLIMIIVLVTLLALIKTPTKKFAEYLKKTKEKERIKNAKEAIFQISELKGELKYRECELKKMQLKELDKEKKQAIKLKKILKK
ncbi:MAG: hypothetical protein Q8L27_02290 [archaeon]|nr:hypothetical protein [archaeon]